VKKFGKVGEFCPNPNCLDFGKIQSEHQRNIKKSGKTRKGVQCYQCKTCGRTFNIDLWDGLLSQTHTRAEDTILRWLRELNEIDHPPLRSLRADWQPERLQ